VRPNSITYGAVINSHANSGCGNAAKRAEKVLLRMERAVVAAKDDGKSSPSGGGGSGTAPKMQTYNQVLKIYSKSQLPGAVRRADVILNHMLCSLDTSRHELWLRCGQNLVLVLVQPTVHWMSQQLATKS